MPKILASAKKKRDDWEFFYVAPELSIWMACFAMINELKRLHYVYLSGKLSRARFNRLFCALVHQLSELAEATCRFDVLWPVPYFGRFSRGFWRWYNWWDDYLKSLDEIVLKRAQLLAQARNKKVEAYRPIGDWITHRDDPSFTVIPAEASTAPKARPR